MRVAPTLTPEVLIEAPRRGSAVPNAAGNKAIYTHSTHSIGAETVRELRLLDIPTGESHRLTENRNVHDAVWLPHVPPGQEDDHPDVRDGSVVYLESQQDTGTTRLLIIDLQWNEQGDLVGRHLTRVVAEFPGPVGQLKLRGLQDGTVALAVVGRVDADGNLFNDKVEEEEKKKKKGGSVRVYDSFNVRSVSHDDPEIYLIYNSFLLPSFTREYIYGLYQMNLAYLYFLIVGYIYKTPEIHYLVFSVGQVSSTIILSVLYRQYLRTRPGMGIRRYFEKSTQE